MSSIRAYISNLVFKPPLPLLDYPLDLADLEVDTTAVDDHCAEIYGRTGIPCICSLYPDARYTIVFSHGNNENLQTLKWYIDDLAEVMCSDVYAYEYPGYVASKHECAPAPSEAGCFAHAEAFIAEIKRITKQPVILWGYSLGSAITLHCAEKLKETSFPHAVVLIAPFVSAASVVLAQSSMMLHFSSLWKPFDVFHMKSSALSQGHPIFVCNGGEDEVVPPSHGKAIAQWCSNYGKSSYLMIPEANHANVRIYSDLYDHLNVFLGTLGT
jgi:pimeloyl-ACP methyl ester carboxylesterase